MFMKLTFVYNNGKTFTANRVSEYSLGANKSGDIGFVYSCIRLVDKLPSEIGPSSELSVNVWSYPNVFGEGYFIDEEFLIPVKETGLAFVIETKVEQLEDGKPVKSFEITPVAGQVGIKAAMLADALKLANLLD